MIITGRQFAALEALIAIEEKRKARPKPSQMEMILDDAKAALDTLRKVQGRAK